MEDRERRQTLARFLRARRERLSPAQVGLPAGGRRRTPGLRREELAQIAGVGATWYTWLEQGRRIRVSASVLDGLSRALRLDPDERAYLFVLAREEAPAEPLPRTPAISPALQHVLDALTPCPSYVMDARWNVVAWNRAACAVLGDFGLLEGRNRNIVWRMFTATEHRALLVHWEEEARIVLALFRASTSRYVGEPWYSALTVDLSRISPEFAAWWAETELRGAYSGRKEVEHPIVGRLVFQPVTLQVVDAPDLRLLAFPPAPDTDTACKMQRLLSLHDQSPATCAATATQDRLLATIDQVAHA